MATPRKKSSRTAAIVKIKPPGSGPPLRHGLIRFADEPVSQWGTSYIETTVTLVDTLAVEMVGQGHIEGT